MDVSAEHDTPEFLFSLWLFPYPYSEEGMLIIDLDLLGESECLFLVLFVGGQLQTIMMLMLKGDV